MRHQPRTFGDGGGVSRRDHAVRTVNEGNEGAGGLSAIDAALRGNRGAEAGFKERGVDHLFRTMDQQSPADDTARGRRAGISEARGTSGNRAATDPYHAANDPEITSHLNGGSRGYSHQEADTGLDDARHDPLTTHLDSRNVRGANNIDAAAYHTATIGTPIPLNGGWTRQGDPTYVRRDRSKDQGHQQRYEVTGPAGSQPVDVNNSPAARQERYGTG